MSAVGLYIHVPFCARKCYYCDFNSYPVEEYDPSGYIEALKWEAGIRGAYLARSGTQVATIYIGGGTPTCLAGDELGEILDMCRENFDVMPGAEVTVEANPGTLDRKKVTILAGKGVNRLSLGVQTIDDRLLKAIGRIHSVADFLDTYALIRESGFSNVNFDLMFALPGQTLEGWGETLRSAVELGPEHISTYNLTIEENTRFYDDLKAGRLRPTSEELDLAMYDLAIDYLTSHGYEHYEISNFARPSKRCLHNLVYWRNEDYIGLGPGAHSHWRDRRWWNLRSPEEYGDILCKEVGGTPVEGEEIPPLEVEMSDTVILGLRVIEGLEEDRFARRFGCSLDDVFGGVLVKVIQDGLVSRESGRIRLTTKGLRLANEVFIRFLG